MTPRKADLVKISYDDLVSACSNNDHSSIDNLIDQAYANSSSLGILAITDIPSLPSLRSKLLALAPKLAALPPQQLEEITAPQSQYQVGWSHGREKLEGDKLDFSKASYYANPLTDDLVESMLERRQYYHDDNHDVHDKQQMEEVLKWDESLHQIKSEEELRQLASANPAFFAPNVWPTNSLPELESALKEMGQLIHQVGVYLAKCCDSYVAARVSVLSFVAVYE
jgi:isopenicillin N synthase-like dioxygenase